jgi:hypothetical protein
LVIIASRGPLHLAALAEHMACTRRTPPACATGWSRPGLDRRDNPTDRRHLLLTLTGAGRELVSGVMQRRRAAIEQILHRMLPDDRIQLATVLTRFATAGGEPDDADLWSVGWTTEYPSRPPGSGLTSDKSPQGSTG